MSVQADITANRRTRNWDKRAILGRLLWTLCQPFFRCSPRIFWGWRVWLLRCFGAQIGRHVHIHPTVRIMIPWHLTIGDQVGIGDRVILYALGTIQIEARATISQNAHLCAGSHDWRDPARPLIRAPIHIGADAWVCADAFVGPGVRIGARAILGARGVAMCDMPADYIGFGNPLQLRPQT